jgi:hypothetical protein
VVRKQILIFFAFLAPSLIGFTETPPPSQPLPPMPLEREEEEGPAYVGRIDVSPAAVVPYGAFTSYQVNVDSNGENILGDAANEPSITMDPRNPRMMAIGWRQFDSVFSSFREGGWAYSSDGGIGWTFPGVLQNNVFRSDPVLFSSDTGVFYYLSLVANFQDDIWRSLNGGESWTKVAFATGGDKQWFTIDNTVPSPGHGFLYQSWSVQGNNYDGRQFTRSTDSGLTWMDPIAIPNVPSSGTLDVDSNGNLFIGGVNPYNGQFWCVRSTDAKNGNVIPTFDQSTQVNLGGQLRFFDPINPEGVVGQVFLAVDRSGTSTNNNVYMLASVLPYTASVGSDVMFARSSDGGQTFSAPKRINDDPGSSGKWHWFGTFAVAPNGRLDSVWLDTRNATDNTKSQLFYSYSTDGGITWSPNRAVTPPFDPHSGYPKQAKMGDYMTIVSDNDGGNVAYCATFNEGEDIYYVRVSPALAAQPPPTPTPVPTPTPTPTPTPSPTPSSPTPTPTPTPSPSPTASPTPTSSPTPTITPAQAINLSTRMRVATGNNIGIGGFIITGSAPKHVLVRVLGPSLTAFGLSDLLADPLLELHGPAGFTTVVNDNWKDDPAQAAAIQASGAAPPDDRESAIDAILNPGSYTALAKGSNDTSGLAVVEVYDLGQAAISKLANISTRAFVGGGDNLVIAGFTLGNHAGVDRVVVRGIGPSLGSAGIANALSDPVMELRDANGAVLTANNNWQEDAAQASQLTAVQLAPSNDLEAAIVRTLPPGAYTALLSGKDGATGVGLVEVYDLGP